MARVLSATIELAKTFVGTPYYLSPELLQNQPYGHATDVWALGVIFYEMCTLRHPFEAQNFPMLAHKILQEQPPPLGACAAPVNAAFQPLADAMLEKDVARRATLPQLLADPAVQRRMLEFVSEAEGAPAPRPAEPAEYAAPRPFAPQPAAPAEAPLPRHRPRRRPVYLRHRGRPPMSLRVAAAS